MAYNPKWNVFNRIIEGDTRIAVTDTGTGQAVVEVDGAQVANFLAAGLQMQAAGARVNEFSIDGTLGGDSDTALPTEKAVKTYVDNAISNLNPDKIWQDDSYVQVVDDGTNAGYVTTVVDGVEVINVSELEQTFGRADDTHITILDGTATVPVGSVEAFAIDEDGISVELGATINEFSTDGTLAGDSDTALPTEQAVKTYVDAQIGGSAHQIIAGDSYVRVVDSTGDGYVEVVVDGTQVQYWDDEATTIRMGKASGAGRVTVTDTTVVASVGANDLLSIAADIQTLGLSTDTYLRATQSTDTISGVAGTTNVLSLTDTTQRVGIATSSRLALDGSGNTANLYAGTVNVLNTTTTAQTLGVSGDTILSLDSGTNTVDLLAGNVSVLNATDTTQRFGASGDTNLTLNTSADTFSLSAGAVTQVAGTLTTITLGVSGDTTIVMDSGADQVAITAGGESQLLIETDGVSVYEDLTVTGNLYVDGTTWVVHNQEVTTSDNLIVINNGEVGPGVTAGFAGLEIDRGTLTDYRFIFDEATDTFRVGEIGGLQPVATREDTPENITVPWWNNTEKRFDTAGNTAITIDTTAEVIAFYASSAQVGTFEADGLTLALGTNINEFSTDDTLAGDSDNAVPTEKAVKTYVDAQIGGNAAKIFEGDSYVEVVDDGTDAGYITIVADGVEVGYFDAEATTQRIGKASGAGRVNVTDTEVTAFVATDELLTLSADTQRIGLSTDTYLQTVQSTNTITGIAGTTTVLSMTDTAQDLGVSGATQISVDQTTDSGTVTVDANNVTVLDLTDGEQILGDAATNLTLYDVGLTKQVSIDVGSTRYFFLNPNADQLLFGTTATGYTIRQAVGLDHTFDVSGSEVFNIDANGIQIGNANARIDEFSTDGTLADDSDTAVPTEKAVKLYVDTAIANLNPDKIWEGDSYVEVVDDGTAVGYVSIVTDGVEVAHFDPAASTQRIGKASGAGRILVADNGVGAYVATAEVLELGANTQQLGIVNDTRVFLTQSTDSIILQAANATEVTVNTSGLALKTGSAVNEISTDGTFTADSDTTLITQKAAKTYIDTEITELRNQLDLINVQYVYSDTTAVSGDVLLVDTTAGDVNIELVEAEDSKIVVKKVTTDGNVVNVSTTPGTIDGKAQIVIDTGYQAYHFVSDSVDFFIL